MENNFLTQWNILESDKPRPKFFRDIVNIDYETFEYQVFSNQKKYIKMLTDLLYAGDVLILKNAFPKKYMEELKIKAYEYGKAIEPSYHPMIDGCPDQHRKIDLETSKKYNYTAVKHSFYFFPWNKDPLNLIQECYKRWRPFKFLSGFDRDIYENNLPSTGPVDRFQIAHYPSGGGMLDSHTDPYHNQRTTISTMMTKMGVHFDSGGFYAVDKNLKKNNIESLIDIGDMCICYATVIHGVDVIDEKRSFDWDNIDGRWFLGFYSNDSNYIKVRKTVQRLDLDGIRG